MAVHRESIYDQKNFEVKRGCHGCVKRIPIYMIKRILSLPILPSVLASCSDNLFTRSSGLSNTVKYPSEIIYEPWRKSNMEDLHEVGLIHQTSRTPLADLCKVTLCHLQSVENKLSNIWSLITGKSSEYQILLTDSPPVSRSWCSWQDNQSLKPWSSFALVHFPFFFWLPCKKYILFHKTPSSAFEWLPQWVIYTKRSPSLPQTYPQLWISAPLIWHHPYAWSAENCWWH